MIVSYELCSTCLFYILIVTGIVHLCYYFFSFLRFAFYKGREKENRQHSVSVILCAKNEVNNLRRYLPSVLEQSYSDYEVIVVNDCSWDEAADYLKEIKPHYPHLKIVTLIEQDKYKHGKK